MCGLSILIHGVDYPSQMHVIRLYSATLVGHQSSGSGEDFQKVLPYMGVAAILIM